jgi:hypothetical protein
MPLLSRIPLLLASIFLGSACSSSASEVERDPLPRVAPPPAGARKASLVSTEAPPEQARQADPQPPEEPDTDKETAPTPEAEEAARKAEQTAEAAARQAREQARRRGKKTGLGAPDEKPEVVVEDLLRAIAARKVDVRRFLDPDRVVLEMTSMPGAGEDGGTEEKRLLCGKPQREVLRYIRHMVQEEKKISEWEPEERITCSHEFADHPDPDFTAVRGWNAKSTWHGAKHPSIEVQRLKQKDLTPLSHVQCSLKTGGEWSERLHVEWVHDSTRGWRIVALITSEVGALDFDLWFQAASVVASDLHCPGK